MDESMYATAEEAKGAVPGEMHRLEATLERLTVEIDMMEQTLGEVLNPPHPEAVLEEKRQQRSRLSDRIDRLEDLTARLGNLRTRLSL
jgi:hypothetical protein